VQSVLASWKGIITISLPCAFRIAGINPLVLLLSATPESSTTVQFASPPVPLSCTVHSTGARTPHCENDPWVFVFGGMAKPEPETCPLRSYWQNKRCSFSIDFMERNYVHHGRHARNKLSCCTHPDHLPTCWFPIPSKVLLFGPGLMLC
jgi:hypothetical protein